VRGQEWTRGEFVRRAAASGVAVAGALAPRWVGEAFAALDTERSNVHTFVTRPDLRPPVLTVLQRHEGRSAGHLFLAPNSGPGDRGGLIADDAGSPIWFRDSRPVVAMNFRAGVYRGKPVLTWWEGRTARGLGDGTHFIMDDAYRIVARVPAGAGRPSDLHEFVLTDRGTALVTAWETRTMDLRRVGGEANGQVVGGVVQELALPSGRVLFEWRSLDHVDVAESHQGMPSKAAFDYFHVNSVELDRDGHYLVSARNTWAIYKIHSGTGEVMWRLGGKKSDFAMGPGTVFAWQHDARRHGGSEYLLSLFDDGAGPPAVQPQSKAMILALDLKRMRATLHRKYTHYPNVLAHALGSVQVLPNSNVLVGWGTAPYITEYSPKGKVLFDAKLPPGGENYRVLRLPWAGRPADPPDVALVGTVARPRVYASWNGSTELRTWRLEAGARAASLEDAGRYDRDGFETEIVAPAGTRFARVTAIDGKGKPLHRSRTARLT